MLTATFWRFAILLLCHKIRIMEARNNFTVIESIEKIHEFSKDSHLRKPLFETVSEEIVFLSKYLSSTEVEAVLFANAFAVWYDDNTFARVFKYLGMKEFQVMKFRKELLNLYGKGLLINKDKSGKRINDFEIPQTVLINVAENKPLKVTKPNEETVQKLNLVHHLENFDMYSDLYDENKIASWEFRGFIDDLCRENSEMPLFAEISRQKLNNFETYFLLDTIWDAVRRGDNDFNTSVQRTVDDYYKLKSNSIGAFNLIMKGETLLTKKGFIDLSKEQFVNRTEAKLSNRMVKFLHENENITIANVTSENTKLMSARKIPERKLFYPDNEKREMEKLAEILTTRKFKSLQSRLKGKKMPFGVTVLLHGAPGTGKTEGVYQLAKKTKRNIFKVDIAETKSIWFGESQKLIKKVFSNYREFCDTEKNTPILLFNEADAVIGKRKSAGSSNVADTENAIQNIILEEMENFEGILIATTNLVENMDAAFERRFLFKIKFEIPNVEVSSKIWKMKFPFLSAKDCLSLAGKFSFSGGEMENIARKCLINELLTGTKPDFQLVLKMCSNEKWSEKCEIRRVGF